MALTVGENSYCSIEYADNYFADRLYADPWLGANAVHKSKALITATRRIDSLSLAGEKTGGNSQSLKFPRRLYDVDSGIYQYTRVGPVPYLLVDTAIPEQVLEATCEEALALLDFGNNHRVRLQYQGVTSFTSDDISESYSSTSNPGKERKLHSQEALSLLRPYLLSSVRFSSTVKRGGYGFE